MKRAFLLLLYLITGCGGGVARSPGGHEHAVPAPETVRLAQIPPDARVHISLDQSSKPLLVLAVGEMGQIDERYTYRYVKSAKLERSGGREEVTPLEGTLGLGLLLLVDEVRLRGSGLSMDVLLEWTAMPGQPCYHTLPVFDQRPQYLEFPETKMSSAAVTVHLREEGRFEEIILPSPIPGDGATATVRLSLGEPLRPGEVLGLALPDPEGGAKEFSIPRMESGSFGVRWDATRRFLSDYDVELGQSCTFHGTLTGAVSEGYSVVYRKGYGGRWTRDLPVDLMEFNTDLGLLDRPVTIEFHEDQKVARGTVRIVGDTVFLDPAADSK